MESRKKEGKELLLELENTGRYLFHGSENGEIDIFEPRQAYDFIKGERIEDDKPGVHATPITDVAILMSLLNAKNCPKGFSSSFVWDKKKNVVVFGASENGMTQLRMGNAVGWVYVFDKSLFERRNEVEYISYNEVKPVKKIKVGFDDLSKDIGIIKDFKR